ncbi:hypothetical protein SERLA73DRAFT_124170 [Serpula lacrymans var. lacrymans S7.3]|uniref:Uncharacterized protein n=1 Tax=Serpula lacrymans var. lacrymans (strain S7.3) TaxID=936435 RepID=F8Q2R5_SERL3|nr:hypothetical protein SERLA73DRAFT_124170 [Serpula lacrymans var. lacrymans S7.3]
MSIFLRSLPEDILEGLFQSRQVKTIVPLKIPASPAMSSTPTGSAYCSIPPGDLERRVPFSEYSGPADLALG